MKQTYVLSFLVLAMFSSCTSYHRSPSSTDEKIEGYHRDFRHGNFDKKDY